MKKLYPTKKELEKIKNWDCKDVKGLLEFLKEIWWMPDWGFTLTGRKILRLELHTGGWSGNEDIIEALHQTFLWSLYWRGTLRGGHYYFKIYKLKKK